MSYLQFLRANLPFLAAGFLLTLGSSFGQTFFISIFAGEIRAAFGLSNGAWGLIYTAATTASALAMVWAGALTDHYRVRALGAVVLALLAAACLGMAALPALWLLPVALFLLRFAGQGMTVHIAVVAMARWFVATRGRALSTAFLGIATGEALLPVGFVALLPFVSWRLLWIVGALAILAILPVVQRLLREERTPQSVATENQAEGMSGRHWVRREVLGHWLFWLLIPGLVAVPAFGTSFFFQQVHLAATKGWAHVGLVALFPLFTAMVTLSMVASGWVIDRIGTGRLMPLFILPMAFGFLLMSAAETLSGAAVAIVFLGLTQGANSTVPNAFWAEYYGTRHLGAIKAMGTAVTVFGTALGPGLTGTLIDLGVDFEDQMAWIAAYFAVAAGLTAVGIGRARPLLPASA